MHKLTSKYTHATLFRLNINVFHPTLKAMFMLFVKERSRFTVNSGIALFNEQASDAECHIHFLR